MRSSFVFFTLLATAIAAPAANSGEQVEAPHLEARAYSCNPLRTNPCPSLCAAGSSSINCSASYCDETSAPNRGVCVCKCHY
ncbi:hypothetical protein B0H63DRAFT_474271 [Podospora didyma]|uniref:Uncharacterized protein n=1 Tax=Podospora didyma TaxID=330526 RepID=A0AAE0U0K2_9PEZI|nr:hypothetical protein B0H63DRAFT_474271 [Podospora didyma]